MVKFRSVRSVLMVACIIATAVLPVSAQRTEASAELHMYSDVPVGFGVMVPEGAQLVGNLLIEYSYDGQNWNYVTSDQVLIDDLGSADDMIHLRASYYGNEPQDYYCDVAFSTTGWYRTDRFVSVEESAAPRDGSIVGLDDSNASLPISFRNLDVSFSGSDISLQETGRSGWIEVDVIPGEGDDSFSLRVPVQNPISGMLVASVQAQWPAGEIASGRYSADIQVAVSANN